MQGQGQCVQRAGVPQRPGQFGRSDWSAGSSESSPDVGGHARGTRGQIGENQEEVFVTFLTFDSLYFFPPRHYG